MPIEPLILRANAGDCIEVNLTNALAPASLVFKEQLFMAPPFNGGVTVKINGVDTFQPSFATKMSGFVGLHPQLLSYDSARSNGMSIGWNRQGQPNQLASFGQTVQYQWYAGKIERNAGGASMTYRLMDEKDIERFMRYPFTAIASDGGVTELGVGNPHPRSYGTNARLLAEVGGLATM